MTKSSKPQPPSKSEGIMQDMRKEDVTKLLTSRHFLILLREAARDMEIVPGTSPGWSTAYADLGKAADRLDAMWARATVPEITDIPVQSLFKMLRKAAERAWIVEVNTANPTASKEEWIKDWMMQQVDDIRKRVGAVEAVTPAKLSKSQRRRLDLQLDPKLGAKARMVVVGGNGKTAVGDIN